MSSKEQRGQRTPSGQRKRVRSSRQRSSDANSVQTSKSVSLDMIPTRQLVASIKRDIRQMTTEK